VTLSRLEWVSAAVAVAVLLLLQVMAAWRADWVLEYPLDDTYIHLSMAEQIARGEYGINPGQPASAASSPLYPILLAPLVNSPVALAMPAVLNLVGLVLASVLFARIVAESPLGARSPAAILVAAGLPVALNLPGLAFSGMEHSLHAAASLAVVLGLARLSRGTAAGVPFWMGLVLAPAFRLEGTGLGLAASVWLWAFLGRREAVTAAVLVLAPVVLFVAVLLSLGLQPVPNSVVAKVAIVHGAGFWELRVAQLADNLTTLPGVGLGVLTAMALIAAALLPKGPKRGLAWVAGAVGAGHLVFGQVGWLDRYEIYASLTIAATLVALAPRPLALYPVAAVALGMASAYAANFWSVGQWAPRGIHLQQGQMAVFQSERWPHAVAVNDIGRLSWRNESVVLDLWGLADREALDLRLGDGASGWAGPLASRAGADLAMVYPSHLGAAIPADWTPLGDLVLVIRRGFLGGDRVTFYATRPEAEAPLKAALAEWQGSLPPGAAWDPAGG
jgi:hypothetical protein